MNTFYSIIALDIARERARDAQAARRASDVAPSGRPGVVRHGLASALALVSRGSTSAVRRLDRYAAQDLDKALTAGR